MTRNIRRRTITASALTLLSVAALSSAASAGNPNDAPGQSKTVSLTAELVELNGSGASGTVTATVRNQLIRDIQVQATGLSPDAPHAQHIHYGNDALNECPTLALDTDPMDGLINTVEGVPAYGPVVVSLTTNGDTTPASVLAVDRYPVSDDGSYSYSRSNIEFTDVSGTGYTGSTGTAKQIADSIREGEGVVVIHGVDYNGNGVYDFGTPGEFGSGASELNAALPREATDPAACGILR